MHPALPYEEVLGAHIAAHIVGKLPGLAGEVRWLALDPGVNHQPRHS